MSKFQGSDTDTREEYPGIDLKGQSLEVMKEFNDLGSSIRAKASAIDKLLARKTNGVSKFRDLLLSKGFPFGATGKLYPCLYP